MLCLPIEILCLPQNSKFRGGKFCLPAEYNNEILKNNYDWRHGSNDFRCHDRRFQRSRVKEGVNANCVSTKSYARVEDVPRADLRRAVFRFSCQHIFFIFGFLLGG